MATIGNGDGDGDANRVNNGGGLNVSNRDSNGNGNSNCNRDVIEYAQAEEVSAGFGVDLESVSDLSCGIGVSETAENWEKFQRTSAGPQVDLIPGGNGAGMRLMHADM